ncbi:MAG: hypothetical protein AAF658_22775, partial [Myxococcota bacterium]
MNRPRIDVPLLASELDVDWSRARSELRSLYAELDERLAVRTKGLDLPCHRGCSACCHESVFVTPLEFLYVWEWAQENLDAETLESMIDRGLELYAEHRDRIEALETAPQEEHDAIARELRFTCPLLGAGGECRVYPVRELYARLFGCSFNDAGGVYGCHLVGAHLADKTVTLPGVRPWAKRLASQPLTFKRQVYPFWI